MRARRPTEKARYTQKPPCVTWIGLYAKIDYPIIEYLFITIWIYINIIYKLPYWESEQVQNSFEAITAVFLFDN